MRKKVPYSLYNYRVAFNLLTDLAASNLVTSMLSPLCSQSGLSKCQSDCIFFFVQVL